MLLEVAAVESRRTELRLDQAQAEALRALGRELAASQSWWGDSEPSVKSVVEVVPLGGNRHAVTFRDVIGVARLGDLQIKVQPKISEEHFAYLICSSTVAPRMAESSVVVDVGNDYVSLLALWCVNESERLLRHGLRPDYNEVHEELAEVRGHLNVMATAMAVQSGRPVAHCEFEEFNDDSPLNRIVKAACQLVAATSSIGLNVRRRARRVAMRMEGVGSLQHSDRYARTSRITSSYGRVLPIARLLLQGGGVTSRIGTMSGRAFLLRTPELVEDGVRNILSRRLASIEVRKRRLQLGTSGVTINPDLVFADGLAVGDVKYRHLREDWDRPSLYQAVAFAAGFRSLRCGIFGFIGDDKQRTPREVPIGDVTARAFAWNASAEASPNSSEDSLVAEVAAWLSAA